MGTFGVMGGALVAPALQQKSASQNPANRKSSLKKYLISLLKVLKLKRIVEILLYAFIIYFLLYTIVTFVPIFLNGFHGFGENIAGIALSIQGLFSAAMASRARLFKSWKWKYRVGGGLIFIAASLLLLPYWSQGSPTVLVSLIIFGTGMGLLNPVVYDRAADLPPKEMAASVIALFNTMKYIGMSVSPALLGLLINYISIQKMFILVGGTLLISTLIMIIRTAAID